MHVISRDSPCYFLTSVAKDRLPVFQTDEIKEIACRALDEARKSAKFALYAYVIMPDHLHAITDSARSSEDTLRFINGIISHRVIAHLKERVHYLHENPVRAGLVERAEDYRYSSVRCWNGKPLEDEPLLMDLDRINWRRSLRKV